MRAMVMGVWAIGAMALVGCAADANQDPGPIARDGESVAPPEQQESEFTADGPATLETVETPAPEPSAPAPATPTEAAPKPDVFTVSIDGLKMTVDSAVLWAPNPVDPNEYDLFIRFHGTGVATGTDLAIQAYRTGAGCKSGENFVSYRPTGDTQYMPAGALGGKSDALCGFSVTALPTATGKRFVGTFDGTLTSINVSPAKTRKVKVSFDVARTK
jgi:hypothetical protein